jgi:hypothetical protein
VDTNKLWRKNDNVKSFRVSMTSSTDYFEANSVSKYLKLGHKAIFSAQPMEVVATEALQGTSIDERKCRLSHETSGATELFNVYSQPACMFECHLTIARDICRCTPWNMPFSSKQKTPVVCDIYGNYCFNQILRQEQPAGTCKCLPDCNGMQFSLSEKEVPIDIDEYCKDGHAVGRLLLKAKRKAGYNELLYRYYRVPEMLAMNETYEDPNMSLNAEKWYKLCKKMMQDIAVVSVRFESKKYVRTIMDKRVTFTDKLAAFGKSIFTVFYPKYFYNIFTFSFRRNIGPVYWNEHFKHDRNGLLDNETCAEIVLIFKEKQAKDVKISRSCVFTFSGNLGVSIQTIFVHTALEIKTQIHISSLTLLVNIL